MIYKLFIAYDLVGDAIAGPILLFPREAPAIRYFMDQLADPNTPYSKHPRDYELREIGTIDEETAQVKPRIHTGTDGQMHMLAPETIFTGLAWTNQQQEQK